MTEPSDRERWQQRYETGDTPWDTGVPSSMLQEVVAAERLPPCRAFDLGCGTGASAVWLAQRGFEVVGVDLSALAIDRARQRAEAAGVRMHFMIADLLQPLDLGPPCEFFFDRGCYHVLRRIDLDGYQRTVDAVTKPGTLGLVLAGNACEKMDPGPPVVTEAEFRAEWGVHFEILWLRAFRFDQLAGEPSRPLGWASLLRKRKPA